MQNKDRDCGSCIMYEYHTYLLPEKINMKKEKDWDRVHTSTCNTCNDYSNWHNKEKYPLNDELIMLLKRELKLNVA
ncbi:MAG: hypothetical protein QME47_07510 [Candidatus Thermoplasmatota archaeon]|nr:hypothetical protein [Candidatus Thermoplasmatota archaeon]